MRGLLAAALIPSVLSVATPSAAAPPPRSEASTVTFRNEMPRRYRLERVRIAVDGASVEGPAAVMSPGAHVVSVAAEYRLNDPFPYMKDYLFQVRSAQRVESEPGRGVVARAVEVGGVTRPIEQRIRIFWR